MTDVEQKLREMFLRHEQDVREPAPPQAPPSILGRARRRQVLNVVVAVIVAAAVIGGSVVGVRRLAVKSPVQPAVNVPAAPAGFRSAPLRFASIAYPEGWFLFDTSAERQTDTGPVLLLTSWDSGRPVMSWHTGPLGLQAIKCSDIPADGVMLTVQMGTTQEAPQPWPVDLRVLPNPNPCGGSERGASWSTPTGAAYYAVALIGPDASADDEAELEQAFASMTFPAESGTQIEDPPPGAGPRIILDAGTVGGMPVVLYAYLSTEQGPGAGGLWLGVAGLRGSLVRGAIGVDTGSGPPLPVDTTMTGVGTRAMVVWGTVQAEVDHVEVKTADGKTFPATIVPLPKSLGRNDRAVWGFVEGPTSYAQGIGYDANGNPLGNPTYATAPNEVIAKGEDPEGGPWVLYITHTNMGDGLGFGFTEHGEGEGCCLSRLKAGQDLRLDGYGTTGGAPSNITAFASMRVARVEFAMPDGRTVEGRLFPMPEKYIGPAQVVLVIVPMNVFQDVMERGDLVAYDSQGNELAREPIAGPQEPSGPTATIDAAWTALRSARDAAANWSSEHGYTFSGFDLTAAVDAEPNVTWNDAPTAVANEVSVRDVQTDRLVLVSKASTGEVYCIAELIQSGGSSAYRYGTQDAQTYDECRGGWGP